MQLFIEKKCVLLFRSDTTRRSTELNICIDWVPLNFGVRCSASLALRFISYYISNMTSGAQFFMTPIFVGVKFVSYFYGNLNIRDADFFTIFFKFFVIVFIQ